MCFYVLKPTVVILVQVCCIFYHTYVIPFKCSTIWMRFYSFKDAVTQKPKHRRKSLSKIQQQCYTLLHFLPLYLDSACSTKGLREPWQHLSLSFSFSLPHHKLIIIICLRFTFACVWQGLCPCQMCHKCVLTEMAPHMTQFTIINWVSEHMWAVMHLYSHISHITMKGRRTRSSYQSLRWSQ